MELHAIETGNFKLDGGAMFGVVPKVLWNKQYPADENNLINLSMRALLVIDGHRKIIIDNGLGKKLDEKFLKHYYLNGDDTLEGSLEKAGYNPNEITDVIMTHLHFDHCGGGVKLNENGELGLTFQNATYWVGRKQWENAMNPNPREKSSYFKDNLFPIEESGQLKFIEEDCRFSDHVHLRIYHGHTVGQILPFIDYHGKKLVYVADLIPSSANIPIAWVAAFDVYPITAMEEKDRFLQEAYENDYTLFFEHDINVECCNLKKTEKGIRMNESFRLTQYSSSSPQKW